MSKRLQPFTTHLRWHPRSARWRAIDTRPVHPWSSERILRDVQLRASGIYGDRERTGGGYHPDTYFERAQRIVVRWTPQGWFTAQGQHVEHAGMVRVCDDGTVEVRAPGLPPIPWAPWAEPEFMSSRTDQVLLEIVRRTALRLRVRIFRLPYGSPTVALQALGHGTLGLHSVFNRQERAVYIMGVPEDGLLHEVIHAVWPGYPVDASAEWACGMLNWEMAVLAAEAAALRAEHPKLRRSIASMVRAHRDFLAAGMEARPNRTRGLRRGARIERDAAALAPLGEPWATPPAASWAAAPG